MKRVEIFKYVKDENQSYKMKLVSDDLLCRDCFYWDKGTCRRYPPQNKWMRQPGMDPKDWCGEHKPKGGNNEKQASW